MSGPFAKVSVCIVDPVGHISAIESALLKAYGVEKIVHVRDVDRLLETMVARSPDLLIVNWTTYDEDWARLMSAVRDEIKSPDPFIMVMLATPTPSHRRIKTAIGLGVDTIVSIPLRGDTFYMHIARLLEKERTFIRTGSYFGPDRRRRNSYVPVERRGKGDSRAVVIGPNEVENWRVAQRDVARDQV